MNTHKVLRPAEKLNLQPKNLAVFLDKDGTLVEDVPYNADPQLMKLTQGAIEGLQLLQAAGYKLIVITNQSGVARGYFPESALVGVEKQLRDILITSGVKLNGFYYCPHHPDGTLSKYSISCNCRKPKPGLILRAAIEQNIDLQKSWFIGDTLNDVEAGCRAECTTILIDKADKPNLPKPQLQTPHYIVPDLAKAANVIFRTISLSGEPKDAGTVG